MYLQMLGLLIGCALGANITLAKTAVSLMGTPTSMTIAWDANVLTNFTLIFTPNGRDTTVASSAGVSVNGNNYYLVSTTGTGSPVQITGSVMGTITTAGTLTLTPLATIFTGFAILGGRVYPTCVYAGVLVNSSLSTNSQVGCGTYHTYAAQSTFTGSIDRNLGIYMGSKSLAPLATDTSRTANTYNVTFYGSKAGSVVTGVLNAAIVAYSTGTVTGYGFWSALSIGAFSSSVSSMDFIGTILTGASGDYWSKTGPVNVIKADNDSSTNCPNNVNTISFGLSTTSANLWYYSHFTRNLVTGDLSCDSTVVSGYTSLCALYKEGTTAAVSAPFASVQDDFFCSVFTFGYYLPATLFILLSFLN